MLLLRVKRKVTKMVSECPAGWLPVRKVKKSAQVNIRFTPQALDELDAAAEREYRDRSEMARFLIEWALARYRRAGSLKALHDVDSHAATSAKSGRISEQARMELLTALETILERAPSAVIEDIARTLTQRAGKYGEPKEAKR
jgi:Arc/MetJ-type ribon-helix-helix transcriptional regulator